METTKRKSKPATKIITAEAIRSAYRDYVLNEGQKPVTVFKFCKEIGITENDFYALFGTFDSVEKSIWNSFIDKTVINLERDGNYATFSSREKILAFYYALVEMLKADRSFVLYQLKDWKNPAMPPVFLKGFKNLFKTWINSVLNNGKQSGEIATRPYVDELYDNVFWVHLMFILQFWSKDDSAGFEKTDVAIEKSVNLAFDVIGKGILDSAIDFGKFLYQSVKN